MAQVCFRIFGICEQICDSTGGPLAPRCSCAEHKSPYEAHKPTERSRLSKEERPEHASCQLHPCGKIDVKNSTLLVPEFWLQNGLQWNGPPQSSLAMTAAAFDRNIFCQLSLDDMFLSWFTTHGHRQLRPTRLKDLPTKPEAGQQGPARPAQAVPTPGAQGRPAENSCEKMRNFDPKTGKFFCRKIWLDFVPDFARPF